ncbi:hypothetical protein OQZ33_04465 [Pedobacter sp. MC2016-05]|uniref:hypothetical protein n=1 Tax=Pedobacter sp. MC2016-05 TaxID=2994474 RepID=UPI002245EB3E|nr:hypothetical protein [Pedobacter sp. MC2016-05]MCX2473580.1 hypothetical protein [Pedobacter sp. MC2016-05]
MIQILNLSGLVADLYPETSITIERNNPLFNDDDKFFEDITYEFALPATENNKEFFSSGHLIEAENSVYELEVQTIANGTPFFAGNIAYTFNGGDFTATLKVNFGAVATKVKSARMHDIFTGDALPDYYTAAYMKTVCQNPAQYPFSFFPVYNESWDVSKGTTHFLVNPWDHASQSFSLIASMRRGDTTASGPFWKLKHYIEKAMQYLGFVCEGSWMNDPESDKIYVYSRYTPFTLSIYDSTVFLPAKTTIADFMKIIKERFNISFSFNLFGGVVRVQSGSSLLASTKSIDISDFITDINEISIPEKNGYTITLEADKQDLLFKDTVNTSDDEYVPTQRMVIGGGEINIEMKASTLKNKVIADYSMPATKQVTYTYLSDGVPEWPWRFIKYGGMKSVAGGKVFPQAEPMELTLADAEWYRFRNDSKYLKIVAMLPLYLLMEIDGSTKINVTSRENAYVQCIIEKITYNMENRDVEYIEATIDCHTVVANYKTPVLISPIDPVLESGIRVIADYNATGAASIDLEIYYAQSQDGSTGGIPRTDKATVLKSADQYGVGGSAVYFPPVATVRDSLVEFRVKTSVPKHAIIGGKKVFFTLKDGYYYTTGIVGSRGAGISDGRAIFIVF